MLLRISHENIGIRKLIMLTNGCDARMSFDKLDVSVNENVSEVLIDI